MSSEAARTGSALESEPTRARSKPGTKPPALWQPNDPAHKGTRQEEARHETLLVEKLVDVSKREAR